MASQTILAGMKFSITGTQNSHVVAVEDFIDIGGILEKSWVALCTFIDIIIKVCYMSCHTLLDTTIKRSEFPFLSRICF